jgi:hypothetical protein
MRESIENNAHTRMEKRTVIETKKTRLHVDRTNQNQKYPFPIKDKDPIGYAISV